MSTGTADAGPLADDAAPPARAGRRPLLVGLAVGAAMLLIVVLTAVSGHRSADDRAVVNVTGDGVQTIAVKLVDLDIVPGKITVPTGARVILDVTNDGEMPHDLAFPEGPATRMLDPGGRQRLDLGVVNASRTGWCTVPGHKQAGMTLTIQLAAEATASTGGDATIDPNATPEPGFRPYPADLAPAGPRVHHVTLGINDQTLSVAPGVTQRMWTFGGAVPGPTLHGRVGDTFVVTVINNTPMGHSIDFHASMVAPDRDMRTIGPGQRLVYRFTARHAGAWMYHCATAPMIQHIGNGMYGAVIIDPPDLAPVSTEYVLVQSELYLGPNAQTGDVTKMTRGTPDAVVFNGYYDQYRHRPLAARAGERVRIWVVDAGLTRSSAFHIVGTQFDTAYSDGAYLVRPDNPSRSAAQALALQPGQGGFVEFTLPEPGHYPFLSHLMVDANRGASGELTAQ